VQRLTDSQVDVRVDGVADECVREVNARFPAGQQSVVRRLPGGAQDPGRRQVTEQAGRVLDRQAAAPHGRQPYQRDGLGLKRQQAPAHVVDELSVHVVVRQAVRLPPG
jgi:hypothetical protein